MNIEYIKGKQKFKTFSRLKDLKINVAYFSLNT